MGTDGSRVFVAVHAGAGCHSRKNEPFYLKACKTASRAAFAALVSGKDAVSAVEIAIMELEVLHRI